MDSKLVPVPGDPIQNKFQNGPLLLSRLRHKVARLEVALRDKDSQLLKLQASTKATAVNELKLQSQIYYEEVLRLKNQLNTLQNQQHQLHTTPSNRFQPLARVPPNLKSPDNRRKDRRSLVKQSPSRERPSTHNEDLSKCALKLKEENKKLQEEVSQLQLKNEKLKEEKIRLELSIPAEVPSRRENIPSPQSMIAHEESMEILKSHIKELMQREKVWEDEKETYREILHSLREDRIFYKEASQQKQENLEVLQNEILKLQQEVLNIQKEFESKVSTGCQECNQRRLILRSASTNTECFDSKPPRADYHEPNRCQTKNKPKPIPRRLTSVEKQESSQRSSSRSSRSSTSVHDSPERKSNTSTVSSSHTSSSSSSSPVSSSQPTVTHSSKHGSPSKSLTQSSKASSSCTYSEGKIAARSSSASSTSTTSSVTSSPSYSKSFESMSEGIKSKTSSMEHQISLQEVGGDQSASVKEEETLVNSIYEASPSFTDDSLDVEVAQEILRAEANISKDVGLLNCLLESHFKRKEKLEELKKNSAEKMNIKRGRSLIDLKSLMEAHMERQSFLQQHVS